MLKITRKGVIQRMLEKVCDLILEKEPVPHLYSQWRRALMWQSVPI